MAYSPELRAFIRKNSSLFWYTPDDKKEEISPEFLVETILNYGSLDDVKTLFKLMGTSEVAKIFFSAEGRKKMNYFPEVYNFFSLFFNRNA
jgi:hypothetical protein